MEKTSAGIDWATEENALCVVDATGRRLAEGMFAHDEAGIRGLVTRMRELGVERVAIGARARPESAPSTAERGARTTHFPNSPPAAR